MVNFLQEHENVTSSTLEREIDEAKGRLLLSKDGLREMLKTAIERAGNSPYLLPYDAQAIRELLSGAV